MIRSKKPLPTVTGEPGLKGLKMRKFDDLDKDQKYLLELLGDDPSALSAAIDYAQWIKCISNMDTFIADPGEA